MIHTYEPHRKYPWFCGKCGYAEHEPLMHPQGPANPSGPQQSEAALSATDEPISSPSPTPGADQ